MNLVAHGIGNVQDLPIPAWMFYWGAAVVLVVSFVMLGALWRRPLLAAHERGRAVGDRLSRFVTGPLRVVVQALSVLLFFLVWASALFGDTDPYRNLAPTWIYVIFWLGVPALSVLLGNVWRALSPWRALAAGTSQYGMQTFDQSIFGLYQQGFVTLEEALRWASNVDEFKLKVQGISTTTDMARDEMARGGQITRFGG